MLDAVGLEVLDTAECLRLLATVSIGRVIFTARALPDVVLVNFVLHEGMIVVPTTSGSKLSAAVRNAVVAFEVDDFDTETWTGWSVTVIGRARLVCAGEELAKLSALDVRSQQPERWEQFVVISADMVNGRRRAAKDSVA
jgi:nitroimidazol reductase NimA-like FMN-containing flavoprotein (pyridoxamine 5'-phosphate oxidase superfamily)